MTKTGPMVVQFLWDRMKTKNFYMILVLMAVSAVSVWILSSPAPTVQTVTSKTHFGVKRASSEEAIEPGLTVDLVYLRRLGLAAHGDPTLTSASGVGISQETGILPTPKITSGLPVIVSGVLPSQFQAAAALMNSVRSYLAGYTLIMFDLGLSLTEKVLLAKYCNSTWNCEIAIFEFKNYPSHVKYLNNWAYRPICIQHILNKYGAVLWLDDGHYFLSGNLSSILAKAKDFGLQAWALDLPTSSVTHPKMFQFFKIEQGTYFFQHAVESSHLVIYNSNKIAKEVLLPWVTCALLEDCISPPGAQNSGCNYFQRPLYKYMGCHHYDMSALNIILGKAFNFNEEPYTSTDKLFGSLTEDKFRAENRTRPLLEISIGVGRQLQM